MSLEIKKWNAIAFAKIYNQEHCVIMETWLFIQASTIHTGNSWDCPSDFLIREYLLTDRRSDRAGKVGMPASVSSCKFVNWNIDQWVIPSLARPLFNGTESGSTRANLMKSSRTLVPSEGAGELVGVASFMFEANEGERAGLA